MSRAFPPWFSLVQNSFNNLQGISSYMLWFWQGLFWISSTDIWSCKSTFIVGHEPFSGLSLQSPCIWALHSVISRINMYICKCISSGCLCKCRTERHSPPQKIYDLRQNIPWVIQVLLSPSAYRSIYFLPSLLFNFCIVFLFAWLITASTCPKKKKNTCSLFACHVALGMPHLDCYRIELKQNHFQPLISVELLNNFLSWFHALFLLDI